MSLTGRFVIWDAVRGLRQEHRQHLRRLKREILGYTSDSDRRDLEATLDRYPDHQTREIRAILAAQHLSTAETPLGHDTLR